MVFETKVIKVAYGFVSKKPHEDSIVRVIRDMGNEGWRLTQRVDGEGATNLMGHVHTRLIFQRAKENS